MLGSGFFPFVALWVKFNCSCVLYFLDSVLIQLHTCYVFNSYKFLLWLRAHYLKRPPECLCVCLCVGLFVCSATGVYSWRKLYKSGKVCNVPCKDERKEGFTQLLEKHPKGKKNFHQSEKRDVVVRTDTRCFEVLQTHWARAILECVRL